MSERNRESGIRLTARGAVAFVLAVTLSGSLLHALFGLPALVGLAFVAGCVGAVLLVNPRDLLSLVVSPPLVFFSATVTVETFRALVAPSPVQAFGLGMFTALSGGAPWLFAGSALVLLIAWRRGLTRCVRELREEIRTAGPTPVPRPRNGDDSEFAPEPEGYFEPRIYGTPREGQ
ncbi:hypothetical protein HS041_00095 [Planomonospora sp. ID67723]|uniref:DUF6542 domain-containing protein n=1 Tax=Planomonospora sp. ID67723 TaxID=2738134 RepID=UPI0018C38BED|nr:DUF6542 domain-containing protein [Planomonospora sp. ID67723]MBG0826185.1 hypothetical protein [Planomonospora sp. ID67723]